MSNEDKFDFTYSAPTEDEPREIESIKKQYMPMQKEEDKLGTLRSLNERVTRPPFIIGLTIGIIGVLILGVGMTMVLEWNFMLWGVIVGVIGLAVAAVAYPIYSAMLKRNKEKYGQQIIDLSDELLHKEEK